MRLMLTPCQATTARPRAAQLDNVRLIRGDDGRARKSPCLSFATGRSAAHAKFFTFLKIPASVPARNCI
jgi:hypothetical protein